MRRSKLFVLGALVVLASCAPPPGPGQPGSTTTTTSTTTVQPPTPKPSDRLNPSEILRAGQSRWSADGRYQLIMQGDGNLVLYAPGAQPLWASNTAGNPGAWTIMQGTDGNLVVYSATNQPLWASNTGGNPGAYLAVQNDANLVIYIGARPIWSRFGLGLWFPLRGSWVIGCTWNNGCSGGYHGYDAIDIARNPSGSIAGDPVYAAGPGVAHIVSRSTICGGTGTTANHVRVNHGNGVTTEYYHLASIAITEGQTVNENTVLGAVGHTGYVDPCTFNHLHFEVFNNGARIDPTLQACLNGARITYPQALGKTSWSQVPRWTAVSNQGPVC